MKKVKFSTVIRKAIISACIALAMIAPFSCNSFLDIVPDDISILDHAFTNAKEAEKFLFACYSYIPTNGVQPANMGLTAGDEIWLPEGNKRIGDMPAWDYIARGEVTPETVAPNYWNGSRWALNKFIGIRDCNTFLEKIQDLSLVQDLSIDERARWVAEVKFLKAFYNFVLFRMYGPIPILDKAIPISADPATVQVKRESVDYCVNYMVNLLDESYADLPLAISNTYSELGRITKPINRALKAKLLLLYASPLFNGNSDYADFRNIDGTLFFSDTREENPQRWIDAAEAAKEAINVAHMAGHRLYEFTLIDPPGFSLTPKSMIQMNIRHAICDRWNSEVVWGLSSGRAGNAMQQACMPKVDAGMADDKTKGSMAPTLQVVKQFYTKNGVPINEDKTLDFSDPESLRVVQSSESVDMETGYTTARINFDREDRFYASIGFDGGKWLMSNHPNRSDIGNYVVKAKMGELSAGIIEASHSVTGYFTKKLVHWSSQFTASTNSVEYAWPEIRLADVYLMYAEALNEAQGPVADVFRYLDRIRERAGLEGVEESWSKYSNNSQKPTTKEGMRAIIRQERLIELALEGHRYYDLLRWKLGEEYLDAPITGWDRTQSDASSYYKTKIIAQRRFIAPRDYFMPIQNSELRVNTQLVQNPGW
jgi:hypothetical protein